jgi:hypothetical protein
MVHAVAADQGAAALLPVHSKPRKACHVGNTVVWWSETKTVFTLLISTWISRFPEGVWVSTVSGPN